MAKRETGAKLGAQTFSISCLTCGVTERLPSRLAIAAFKLQHRGHLVKEGAVEPEEAPSPVMVSTEELLERSKAQKGSRGSPISMALKGLLVDVLRKSESGPVTFRVVGVAKDGNEAFVIPFGLDQGRQVRDFLGKGEFVRQESGDKIRFTWDSGIIQSSKEAADMMEAEEQPKGVRTEKETSQAQQAREVTLKGPVAKDQTAITKERERAQPEPLLLAKSSYVAEGEEYRNEAAKISRALRSFRWKIEPPYAIGVLFDDLLSIETSIGLISGALVKTIEDFGYKLVALNAESGKPTAWFKKTSTQPSSEPSFDKE